MVLIKVPKPARFATMDAITELFILWEIFPDWTDIKEWLRFLEQESEKRKQYLKVCFVYGSDRNYSKQERQIQLEELGNELKIKNMALTFVSSFSDSSTEVYLNNINLTTENTFIIYRYRSIVDKYIELKPTAENFKMISHSLDRTFLKKTTTIYLD